MSRTRLCRSLLLISTVAGLSACLQYPRNNQEVDTKTTEISFEGWYPNLPGIEIKLYQNVIGTSTWDQIPHAPILTGANPLVDNDGTSWYHFAAADVVLSTDEKYWKAGSGRHISAVVKALGAGNQQLTTFEVDDGTETGSEACIQHYRAISGGAVIQYCASSSSPEVALQIPCGTANKTCCKSGNKCDFGRNCTSNTNGSCTLTCGSQGQTCCVASPGCGANTICQSNTCVHCGNTSEVCCSGSACAAGNVCNGGTGKCELCGGSNQLCCGGAACSPGFACDGTNHCKTCGGLGEICCTGATCDNNGLACNGGTNKCETCGGVGQLCCPGNACGAGNTCNGATKKCEACGATGQLCCGGTTCTSAGDACNSGTKKCENCGGNGQLCCGGSSCDNGSLACQGGHCTTCGVVNGPCCGGNSCGANAVCNGSTCVACGGLNQVCCNNYTTCTAAGTICKNPGTQLSRCLHCGLQGQPCCSGNFGCDNSAPYCTDFYSAGSFTCQSQPPP